MAERENELHDEKDAKLAQQAEEIARLNAALKAVTESDHPYDVAWAALHKEGEA
jgi:hypothetical protein